MTPEPHVGAGRKNGVAAIEENSCSVLTNLADVSCRMMCGLRQSLHIVQAATHLAVSVAATCSSSSNAHLSRATLKQKLAFVRSEELPAAPGRRFRGYGA